MDREEKIKVAITAGIAGLLLLILVIYLALSGVNKTKDSEEADSQTETTISEDAGASTSEVSQADNISEQTSAEASENAADTTSSKDESAANSSVTAIESVNTISGNSLYKTNKAFLNDKYKTLKIDAQAQLKEMYGYWNDGNMAAVRDLAHLERFEAMTYALSSTSDYYYYGELNADGLPEGTGLAIYADDQYYFGQWKGGKREGEGTWISFYPEYNDYVVTEHLYTGEWSGDLPNGKGQEHYDYNKDKMNEQDFYIQNAIGYFYNGLYSGEMYMITVDKGYNTREWYGNCVEGTWQQILHTYADFENKKAVLYEKDKEESYIWMSDENAKDYGVSGIIYNGNMVKK